MFKEAGGEERCSLEGYEFFSVLKSKNEQSPCLSSELIYPNPLCITVFHSCSTPCFGPALEPLFLTSQRQVFVSFEKTKSTLIIKGSIDV